MAKHCPYCGKSSEEAKFVQNYCTSCYAERVMRLEVPAVIGLEICKTCNRVRLDGRMSEDYWLFLEKRIKKGMKCNYETAIEKTSFNLGGKKAVASIRVNNEFFVDREVEVREKNLQCRQCSRRYSGYFEAIIQLRGNEKRMHTLTQGLLNKIEALGSFASKVEELKEGNDVYVADKITALQAAAELGIKFTTSKKLAGRKDGRQLYRTTICVRL